MVEAKWSGRWPNLCSGEWTLMVDEKDVSGKIPDELRSSEMNTYGSYQKWHFVADWEVEWESYHDGLECEEWIKENKSWLDTISTDQKTQSDIFYVINASDWRHGSCGGCI